MQFFPDYGFKLVILNALLDANAVFLEELEKIKSIPSISRRLAGEEAYGEIIPEMDNFFRSLEICEDDLLKITTLWFDGGNDIYHLIRPFWSGEDDDFDILSVDGFEHLKNLESVHNHAMISDEQISRLEKAGIKIE